MTQQSSKFISILVTAAENEWAALAERCAPQFDLLWESGRRRIDPEPIICAAPAERREKPCELTR